MKLETDLVREVLLGIEEFPSFGPLIDLEIENYSDEQITYHVMLLNEAGLIEALDLSSHDGVCWKPRRLTYSGHEFLNAARSDTVWSKAKAVVLKSTGALTLEGLKIALPLVVKSLITGA